MADTISWLKDPLLYDIEPTVQNKWLTANELIKANRIKDVFHNDEQILNLYPILVRKIDFVKKNSSDRILSRFPYLVLTQEEKEQIQKKILLISEFAQNYFYNSINNSILTWRKRFNNYLVRGAIPYPLFRCACEILQKPLVRTKAAALSFESARGKRYSIPTKISKCLAYLCGVINGDGHLHQHWLRVVDETKEHIEFISELNERLFDDPGELFQTGNAWNAELRSSSAVRLFNFLTSQTIQGAKYESLQEPLLLKKLGEPYRSLYWRGAMDADGSFKNGITFVSASRSYVNDLYQYLSTIGISSTIYSESEKSNYLFISAHYKVAYTAQIGTLNPKKASDLQEYLHQKHTKAKYQGIAADNVLPSGYFNLYLLKKLCLKGLGDFLHTYRNNRKYIDLDREYKLANGVYSNYEKEKTALPFDFFTLLVMKTSRTEDRVYDILTEKQSVIRFQVANSVPIKLPLQPNEDLYLLLPYLEPKSSYVAIITREPQLKQQIEQLFDIKIENQRINSRILVRFLRTFCNYQSTKYLITPKVFSEMQSKWKRELFDI